MVDRESAERIRRYEMTKTTAYYESVGDSLTGQQAERAYRAAQNALMVSNPGYMDGLKRLQAKIIASL